MKNSDVSTSSNTRKLIRMMKRWQAFRNVPLKSFWIEIIAIEFMLTWEHKNKSTMYFDWIVRDFLIYLEGKAYGTIYAPGTFEAMYLGSAWLSKATTARQRAENACDLETKYPALAGNEWQKIFGADIPIVP